MNLRGRPWARSIGTRTSSPGAGDHRPSGSRIASSLVLSALATLLIAAGPAQKLHYTATWHGLTLMEADLCLRITDTAYAASLSARTVGLIDVLVHARSQSHVIGTMDAGGAVHPGAYTESSRLAGEDYAVRLSWRGADPVLLQEVPAQETFRLPIPANAEAGTVDGLSSVVVQSIAASRHGACGGQTRVYDGRQVRLLSTHDGTADILSPRAAVLAGPALSCATDSAVLAGFLKSRPVPGQARPRHGRLWMAPAQAGGPAVPVRMVFDADAWGEIVAVLDGVSACDEGG